MHTGVKAQCVVGAPDIVVDGHGYAYAGNTLATERISGLDRATSAQDHDSCHAPCLNLSGSLSLSFSVAKALATPSLDRASSVAYCLWTQIDGLLEAAVDQTIQPMGNGERFHATAGCSGDDGEQACSDSWGFATTDEEGNALRLALRVVRASELRCLCRATLRSLQACVFCPPGFCAQSTSVRRQMQV